MSVSISTIRPWFRPGRWLYQMWYRPLGWCERSWREGGPFAQWQTAHGRRALRCAGARLRPRAVVPPLRDQPALAFLTGENYWEQTAFCLRSLQVVTPARTWSAFAVDDGTLRLEQRRSLENAFPGLHIYEASVLEDALDRELPSDRFPTLRTHRKAFKLLRKLTDLHAVRPGWNVVLDADMLFLASPHEFLAWFDSPPQPLVLTDVGDAYGYTRATLTALAGAEVASCVNTGVCGLHTSSIDWARLEAHLTTLLATCGSSYFLEQALVALTVSGKPYTQLSRERYRVLPTSAETRAPTEALHHYVADSKRDYFRHSWRPIARVECEAE